MANYNPDLMQLDDGATGAPRVFGARTDTSQITDAEIQAASIAAAKQLAAVPYAELPADVKKSMTAKEKQEYVTAQREEATRIAREEATYNDPLKNPNQRPDAQTKGDNNYIQYYSWVGGYETGSWRLTRVPRNEDNLATYGGRQVGGPTMASQTGNISDANGLIVQPKPIRDNDGQITGWEVGDTNAIDLIGTDGRVSSGTSGNGFTSGTSGSGFTKTGTGGTTGNSGAKSLVAGTGNPLDTTIADQKKADRVSAYNLLYSEFDKYGIGSLVSDIKDYLVNSTFDPSEFSIQLKNTPAYAQRFAANADRIKAGLSALKPAEYIALEDQYQSLMRNYGLPESYSAKGNLGIQEGFNKLIANDVSATELEDRITTAQQRVVNADPNVLKTLKSFYPDITNGDILAYTLDPKNAIDMIKRKVTAAEIGSTQYGAGLNTNEAAAMALTKAGVTQGQYAQAAPFISQASERGTQLADIYGQTPYDQSAAEAEALNLAGGAQAAAKRKKLTGLEQAAFSGSSGVGALGRDKAAYGLTQGQTGLY